MYFVYVPRFLFNLKDIFFFYIILFSGIWDERETFKFKTEVEDTMNKLDLRCETRGNFTNNVQNVNEIVFQNFKSLFTSVKLFSAYSIV